MRRRREGLRQGCLGAQSRSCLVALCPSPVKPLFCAPQPTSSRLLPASPPLTDQLNEILPSNRTRTCCRFQLYKVHGKYSCSWQPQHVPHHHHQPGRAGSCAWSCSCSAFVSRSKVVTQKFCPNRTLQNVRGRGLFNQLSLSVCLDYFNPCSHAAAHPPPTHRCCHTASLLLTEYPISARNSPLKTTTNYDNNNHNKSVAFSHVLSLYHSICAPLFPTLLLSPLSVCN